MPYWLNRQNKKHFALYSNRDDLYWIDSAAEGMSILLFKQPEGLNKRLSRMSPRRGKKDVDRIINKLLEQYNAPEDIAEDIIEFFDQDVEE